MNTRVKIMTLLGMLALFNACEKDDNSTEPSIAGDIVISTILPNPDGSSGSAYMQLIDGLQPKNYNSETAFPIAYGFPPTVIGDDIFVLPGWSQSTNVMEKYTRRNGKLTKTGSLNLPAQSGANAIVTKGNKAYVSLSKLGEILVVDYVNMKELGKIDITSYGIGDENPDPSQMIIRENLLFVGLNQLVGGYTPDVNRPKTDILIIDTETDKPIKMITEETSGFSMPTKPEADAKSIFMDENKDIYINCISGFGMIGHKAGFLRIKNGETDFDKSYQFVVSETDVEGEAEKINYIINVQYKENGKLYATGNSNAYFSASPDYAKDRSVLSVEIDIYSKAIKKLPLPHSNSYSAGVSICKDLVIFGLATTQDKGFYTYKPATGLASPGAVIKVEGFPYCIREFGTKY